MRLRVGVRLSADGRPHIWPFHAVVLLQVGIGEGVFGCTVDVVVPGGVGVVREDVCLFEFVEVEGLVIAVVLELEDLDMDCPVDLGHLCGQVVDIYPCDSASKNVYILSLPSPISDLNRKWYNPWLRSTGNPIIASFIVIYIPSLLAAASSWANWSRSVPCCPPAASATKYLEVVKHQRLVREVVHYC